MKFGKKVFGYFYKNELEIKNIVCKVVITMIKLLQNMYRNRKEKLT